MLAAAVGAGGPALLAACGGGSGSSGGGATKTDLKVGLGLDVTDLNGFDLTINSYPVLASIYDTLLTYDKGGKAVPRLAQSWKISSDQTSVEVKLRKGLTFHNGETLDAAAVVKNLEKASDPQFAFQVYSVVAPIAGFDAPDGSTVRIKLKQPTPAQVITDILDSINLMAPKSLDFDALKHTAVGAGPFAQTAFTPHNQLVLERFDHFWRKPAPSIKKITFQISSDYDASIASLQAGTLDMVAFVPPNQAVKVKDRFDIFVGPTGLEVYPLRINPGRPPFDNKAVRQALHYAIDRKAIVERVFYGYSKPTVLLFGEGSAAFDPSALAKYPFDLQRAKKAFAAAGAAGWSATCNLVNTDTVGQSIIQILQADLAKIGCKLDVHLMGNAESAQRAFSGDYQMEYGIFGNCGKYPTWVTLNSLCRVQNNPVLKGSAAPILQRWQSAIARASGAVTKDEQQAAFKNLRDVLLDESWVIPICQDQTLVAMSKKASGVSINRDDFVVLEDVKVNAT
jgi:peptide/nickel transport system substrate-binding protein